MDVFGYDLRQLEPGQEPSGAQVIRAVEEAVRGMPAEVVFTGLGEPTLRFDPILEVSRHSRKGLRTRLDTNGQGALINPARDVVSELKAAGLAAVFRQSQRSR